MSFTTDDYEVYLGFWTNWTHGRYQGATLTLTRQSGGLLIAFLALYVRSCGNSLWRLGCLAFHRYLSSADPEDGLYHQRQTILRNESSALGGTWSLTRLWIAWRKQKDVRRQCARIFPIVGFAMVSLASFAVAGIFSSRITTNTANEVLLSGRTCGLVAIDALPSYQLQTAYQSRIARESLSYTLDCYNETSTQGTCQFYIRQRLPFTSKMNITCPFTGDICRLSTGNLLLDSGFLDSHDDLGINAPPAQRFLIRFVNQCAPLRTDGFSKIHANQGWPNITLMRYYYGAFAYGNETKYDRSFTFETPVNFSRHDYDNHPIQTTQAVGPDYNIQSVVGSIDFTPIQQLQYPDADVLLLFLTAAGIKYLAPTDDPWYAAHQPSETRYSVNPNFTNDIHTYIADQPAGVLGCTLQNQVCNPNHPKATRCTPLSRYYDINEESILSLWPDATEKSRMSWLAAVITHGFLVGFDAVARASGVFALNARSSLNSGDQTALLPENQWQIEMQTWFQIMLASLQAVFVDTANGPHAKDLEPYLVRPNATSRWMCHDQKILSTAYYSFSVLGMSTILVVGGIIIILDWSVDSIRDCVHKRRKNLGSMSQHGRLEWKSTGNLQLQRLAHEELGLGTWSHATDPVPVTEGGQALGVLDISNKDHPVLQRPSQHDSDEEKASGEGSGDRSDAPASSLNPSQATPGTAAEVPVEPSATTPTSSHDTSQGAPIRTSGSITGTPHERFSWVEPEEITQATTTMPTQQAATDSTEHHQEVPESEEGSRAAEGPSGLHTNGLGDASAAENGNTSTVE